MSLNQFGAVVTIAIMGRIYQLLFAGALVLAGLWSSTAALADVVIVDQAEQPVLRYTKSYALLVGISKYEHWGDLASVPKEIAEVREVLEEHGFEVETALNLDEESLRGVIQQFVKKYGFEEDHRLIFYFAGHGYSRPVHGVQRGYLVPADAPLPNSGDDASFPAESRLDAPDSCVGAESRGAARALPLRQLFLGNRLRYAG